MAYPIEDVKWTVSIDKKPTFFGVLKDHFDEIGDRYNLSQKTRKEYAGEYERHIIPRLNDMPLEKYTAEDFEQVILDIASEGDGCARSTLQKYRMHISRVIEAAVRHGKMQDPLWGVMFNEILTPKQVQQTERRTLPKSFTVQQQCEIGHAIYTTAVASGDKTGLMLSYEAGLRLKEDAGTSFGDLQENDNFGVVAIHTSTQGQGHRRHSKLKTKNANRLAVLGKRAVDILKKKKEAIINLLETGKIELEEGSSIPTVATAPIAGMAEKPLQPYSSTQISQAFRAVLRDAGYDNEDFLAATRIVESEEFANAVRTVTPGELGFANERSPTAYILRRQFCTDMHIVGCTPEQIQYAMGHRIENPAVDRRDFRNEDKLEELAEKLNKRPSVNQSALLVPCHVVSGEEYHNDDFYEERVRLPMRKGKLVIRVSSLENLASASVKITLPEGVDVRCRYYEYQKPSPQNKEVNILNDYYEDFRRAYEEMEKKQACKQENLEHNKESQISADT